MCPSIPLSVNSGMKLAMMIVAAKKIDLFTSRAELAMVRNLPPRL